MAVALNRKRSRLAVEDGEEEVVIERSQPAKEVFTDTLKRSKTDSELDELDIVTPEEAWAVDMPAILASPTLRSAPGSSLRPHDNVERFEEGRSIVVLCVQGSMVLHYDLLCSFLPDLYIISPSLQALVLCRDPSTHVPSDTAPISLPLVRAIGPNYNHFVKLGLLHPAGGGHFPLDALVVLDQQGRRRLVLPFGWGPGRHAAAPGGKTIQIRLMDMLTNCIRKLAQEQ